MDKHTFDIKSEALNGQIRQEKIRGLQHDVNAEKANADGKMHFAAQARVKANIAHATNGNVRKVQKLSRHVKLETLMIYDDNRASAQGEITNLLSNNL